MNSRSRKESKARTGSNVESKAWAAYWHRVAEQTRRDRQHRRPPAPRGRTALLTPGEVDTVTELIQAARHRWHDQNLREGGNSADAERRKVGVKRWLRTRLSRMVPTFRRADALQKKYHRTQRTALVAAALAQRKGRATISWGGGLTPAVGDVHEFTAPFELFDYTPLDIDNLVVNDWSFVQPEIGHLAHNLVVEHNESDWSFYNPGRFVISRAACGIRFTMPSEGRLRIVADLQNIAHRVTYSIRDNFGFSHANLSINVSLFIAVTRPGGEPVFRATPLHEEKVSSDGDPLDRTLSQLDNSLPYAIESTTPQVYPAGDAVEILGGVYLRIDSDTDDMDVRITPTSWWQLRKLRVSVV